MVAAHFYSALTSPQHPARFCFVPNFLRENRQLLRDHPSNVSTTFDRDGHGRTSSAKDDHTPTSVRISVARWPKPSRTRTTKMDQLLVRSQQTPIRASARITKRHLVAPVDHLSPCTQRQKTMASGIYSAACQRYCCALSPSAALAHTARDKSQPPPKIADVPFMPKTRWRERNRRRGEGIRKTSRPASGKSLPLERPSAIPFLLEGCAPPPPHPPTPPLDPGQNRDGKGPKSNPLRVEANYHVHDERRPNVTISAVGVPIREKTQSCQEARAGEKWRQSPSSGIFATWW